MCQNPPWVYYCVLGFLFVNCVSIQTLIFCQKCVLLDQSDNSNLGNVIYRLGKVEYFEVIKEINIRNPQTDSLSYPSLK